jgi:hypothetical protein
MTRPNISNVASSIFYFVQVTIFSETFNLLDRTLSDQKTLKHSIVVTNFQNVRKDIIFVVIFVFFTLGCEAKYKIQVQKRLRS